MCVRMCVACMHRVCVVSVYMMGGCMCVVGVHVCSLYGCGGCMHSICAYEMTCLCWFGGVCVR